MPCGEEKGLKTTKYDSVTKRATIFSSLAALESPGESFKDTTMSSWFFSPRMLPGHFFFSLEDPPGEKKEKEEDLPVILL